MILLVVRNDAYKHCYACDVTYRREHSNPYCCCHIGASVSIPVRMKALTGIFKATCFLDGDFIKMLLR